MGEFVFTDRYDVLSPPLNCKGPCEGTGYIPIWPGELDEELAARWIEAHAACKESDESCDGVHFIRCPVCE
jgi:hypothetical protein